MICKNPYDFSGFALTKGGSQKSTNIIFINIICTVWIQFLYLLNLRSTFVLKKNSVLDL